ncbi:hypothetical protein SEA_MEYRAN_53 [Gordonia phage Meyran]|nr:hypothetical protein SEA_MEYRAN_53 [Gordonia phage Meyran]
MNKLNRPVVVELRPDDVIPFCTECGARVYRREATGLWWHLHGPDFFGPCDWGRPYPRQRETA